MKKILLMVLILFIPIVYADLAFHYYPLNGHHTSTAQRLTFMFNESANFTLEYGTTKAYGNYHYQNISIRAYDEVITGLSADTTYHYKLTGLNKAGSTAWESNFTTKPSTDRTFSFCQWGDSHMGYSQWSGVSETEARFYRIMAFCRDQGVDFMVTTGDTYEGNNWPNYRDNLRNLSVHYSNRTGEIPLYTIPSDGHNKENGDTGNYLYLRNFSVNPQNGNGTQYTGQKYAVGNETVWCFNYSYGLFCGISDALNLTPESVMFKFLNSSLNSVSNDTFKAVFKHPMYNTSRFNEDDTYWDDYLPLFLGTNTLQYSGHWHSAGVNMSQNQIRASPIVSNFDTSGHYLDDWSSYGKAHFSLTTVTATEATIIIYNDTPLEEYRVVFNYTSTSTPSTPSNTTTTTVARAIDQWQLGFYTVASMFSVLMVILNVWALLTILKRKKYEHLKVLAYANLVLLGTALVSLFAMIVISYMNA